MSSSDFRADVSGALRRIRGLVLVGLVAGLAACTVRPVYMPVQGAGHVVAADLSAITVQDAVDRVGQEVRNNLVFNFTGGRTAPPPRFQLLMTVSVSEQRLGFEKDETAPAYQVTVSVNYELKDLATGRSIRRSSSTGVASYDRSNQNFANVRARIDAENRAAVAVADEIQLQLAMALANDKPPAAPAAAIAPNPAAAKPAKSG